MITNNFRHSGEQPENPFQEQLLLEVMNLLGQEVARRREALALEAIRRLPAEDRFTCGRIGHFIRSSSVDSGRLRQVVSSSVWAESGIEPAWDPDASEELACDCVEHPVGRAANVLHEFGTGMPPTASIDPELHCVIDAWAEIGSPIRRAIMALVESTKTLCELVKAGERL